MNARSDVNKNKLDPLKWVVVIVLLTAGVVGNYYFAAQPAAIRMVGWIVVVIIAGFVALQTVQGSRVKHFAKESRTELRKVVWPTRQETVQTTMIVAAMVVATALVLWGIDSVLLWAISWLTGQRG